MFVIKLVNLKMYLHEKRYFDDSLNLGYALC